MGYTKGIALGIATVFVACAIDGCGDSSPSSVNDVSENLEFDGSSSSIQNLMSSSSEFLPIDLSSSSAYNPNYSDSSSFAVELGLSSSSEFQPYGVNGSESGDSLKHVYEHEGVSSMGEIHMSSSFMEIFPSSSSNYENESSSSEALDNSSSSKAVLYSPYIVGADISRFQEYESYGTKIYDTDGTEKDIFTLLKDHGFNAIRLKTFVSPKANYGYASTGCGQDSEAFGDKDHVVAYAQKVKKAGFTFLLDIHYSDIWADPDTQIIPERWRGVTTSDAMADSVYAYTYDLLSALKNVNALPDMVQVGNEITNGMLRDLPTSSTNCWGDNVTLASNDVNGIMDVSTNPNGIANTAKYLAAGSRAVKAISNNIKTVFHIESPQNTATVNWWMNSIINTKGVSPDVMAFSAYTAYQHGTPDTWKTLFTSLAGSYPNQEFLIAEYNGGTANNTYSYDGSRANTLSIMEQVPRGLGAFFWEPASYGEWGAALFDWDGNNLKANEKAFGEYADWFESEGEKR